MAAALLARRAEAIGVDVAVGSAGLRAQGDPAAPFSIEVMKLHAVDLSGHRSRRVDRSLVTGADLVLTMERAHLREVVLLAPPVFGRCFTLKEIVRRGGLVGPRLAGETLAEWLARVHIGREAAMLLGADAEDDIADPYGSAREMFEETASQLATLVDRFATLAWPDVA
jgi:protein-tyrosine phosphatase